MRFINCTYQNFLNNLGNRKIVQFGASSVWSYYFNVFPDIENRIVDRTFCIVDNAPSKQGTEFIIGIHSLHIDRPDALRTMEDYVILITVSIAYQEKICRQLVEMNLDENIECFSLPLMILSFEKADNSAVDIYFHKRNEQRIPAIIHSFWFSGEEKPELYKKCIDSWHKYCPDFEIIEWNTDNYDISQNVYMQEAFERRKWAFVSDYARLDVIYRMGGVYLDMDVELVSKLNPYLYADCFFCRQEDGMIDFGSGFGAPKGNRLIGDMRDSYNERHFILSDGNIDKTPQPELMSSILLKNGIDNSHNSQVIDDIIILSNDYITCNYGANSIMKPKLGIHWHNGSWLDEKDRSNLKAAASARKSLINNYFVFCVRGSD